MTVWRAWPSFVLLVPLLSGCLLEEGPLTGPDGQVLESRVSMEYARSKAAPLVLKYRVHIHDVHMSWDNEGDFVYGNFTLTEVKGEEVLAGVELAISFINDRHDDHLGTVYADYTDFRTEPEREGFYLQPYESRIFNFSIPTNLTGNPKYMGFNFDGVFRYNNQSMNVYYNDMCQVRIGNDFIHQNDDPSALDNGENVPNGCTSDAFYYYYYGLGHFNSNYYIGFDLEEWPAETDVEWWSHYCPHCYGADVPGHHVTYDNVEPYCSGDVRTPNGGGVFGRGCGYGRF